MPTDESNTLRLQTILLFIAFTIGNRASPVLAFSGYIKYDGLVLTFLSHNAEQGGVLVRTRLCAKAVAACRQG